MGPRRYILLFLTLLLVCGSYASIYFLQIDLEDERGIYIILSLITYLVVISGLSTGVFAWSRRRHLQRPVDYLGEAARKDA